MRVTTTDLQNAFGRYLSLTGKEDIIVVKNGKAVAKLVSYADPEYYIVHEESRDYNSTKKVSYEQYMDLVNTSDQRYELIDGEIYLMSSPSFNHQIIVSEIFARFYNYFKDKPCRPLTAPFDVRLFGYATKIEEDPNIVQPDISVVCDEEKVSDDNKYEGIPTLIVEVLSPSTKGKDMVAKLNLYMKSGVLEYWIVDPDKKCVIQYSFSKERDVQNMNTFSGDDTIKSKAFNGLEIKLKEVL